MKTWPVPEWLGELPSRVNAGAFAHEAGFGPQYVVNGALAELTTIKVGGPAEVLATVHDWGQMAALRRFCTERKVALTLVGKGSNMVVRDGGIGGVVVLMGKGVDRVEVRGEEIYAEAGVACGTVARAAREAGLAGLAFFGGIPGSIGGALRMNAGAYGSETFDALVQVWCLDALGEERVLKPLELKPRYRGTELPEGWIYKAGLWRLAVGDKEQIREQMREINRARSSSQPLHMPSSGSWFKNVVLPRDIEGLGKAGEKVNAWKVVDAAGCRGWVEGGAQVSEQHCNFFVNTGNALARDFDVLSERVEVAILDKLGIVIGREVRFVGVDG
ncbi:MAG: UDP-N-acetylmuramate dehydrogenase [Proteobacteria bacterium]|nr:UDP-N-acetylmuramate dehydrogenase [Pseudomonadota bacterium]